MKKLMRLLGYEPIQNKQPTEFQLLILRALREMTIRELAVFSQTSLSTIQRWASGQTSPYPAMEKVYMKFLLPEVERREKELHERLFGKS